MVQEASPSVLGRFSRSVRSAAQRLEPGEEVTAGRLAEALLRLHPELGPADAAAALPGRRLPVEAWLTRCAGLFDMAAVASTPAQVVDARLFLLGLARLEPPFDELLRRRQLRQRLQRADVPLPALLRPWARPVRAVEWLEVVTISTERNAVSACAFSPDGRVVACGRRGSVDLHSIASLMARGAPPPALPPVLPALGPVEALAFSPDGRLLAYGGPQSQLIVVELAWGVPAPRLDAGQLTCCAFSPDGRLLVSADQQGMVRLRPVADEGSGTPLLSVDERVHACTFSADGSDIVAVCANGRVVRCDVGSGAARDGPESDDEPVGGATFGAGGRLLATVRRDGTIRIRELGAPEWVMEIPPGPGPEIRSMAFTDDGRLLATGRANGITQLWDVAAGLSVGEAIGAPSPVLACAIGADGRLLATGDETGTTVIREAVDAQVMLPAVAVDAPAGEDLLDLDADVSALASLIAAEATTPPLSIGLFGDWGAGKSFLIGKVQQRVDQLSRRARRVPAAAHCGHVRNVTFNAWHYADANLWASLVSHIFDALASPEEHGDPARAREQVARLRQELASRSEVRDRLERSRAQTERLEARRRLLRWTWGLFAGPADVTLAALKRDAGTLGLLFPTLRARVAAAGVAVACGLVVALLVGLGESDWLVRAATGLVGAAGTLVAWIGVGHRHVEALIARVGPTATVGEMRGGDIEAELAAARDGERVLREELADLAAGRRLARFAAERGTSGDYRAQLGIVSRIHEDFRRMSDILLAQSRLRAGGVHRDEDADLPAIDRVVLYIDDLDRCPPSRVVAVLEAMHLILAVPLFVVVVAVDPRWLLQSLRLHYSQLLAESSDGGRAWESTPLHYLEKIIQIPFTVRPLATTGVAALIGDLLPVQPDEPPPAAGPPADPGPAPVTGAGPGAAVRRDPAAAGGARPVAPPLPEGLRPRALFLTEPEGTFAANVGCLLRTPRSVKAFTNLYRLVRTRLDEAAGELDAFLDDTGGDVPEYEAVLTLLAVMLAFPDEAPEFLAGIGDLDPSLPADTRPWSGYVDEVASRWPEIGDVLRRCDPPATATREPFRRWALEVSRYSFATGQAIYAQYRAGRRPTGADDPRGDAAGAASDATASEAPEL